MTHCGFPVRFAHWWSLWYVGIVGGNEKALLCLVVEWYVPVGLTVGSRVDKEKGKRGF
jgi:hypothetical protein